MEKKQEENNQLSEEQPKPEVYQEEEEHEEDDNLEEENVNKEEHPAKKLLEPHQAFEIYAALPIAHQRLLLPVWRSIYEDEPIPDEWARWKIYEWSGNQWNSEFCQNVQLSNDGLNFSMTSRDGYVRAIRAAEFLPTRMDGPQFCYFETKRIAGNFWLGFSRSSRPANFFGIRESGHYVHGEYAYRALLNAATLLDNEIATLGCGLIKHLGKRKIFFTKNGKLIAKPIPLPSITPNELFPIIFMFSADCQFVATNFGLKQFQFKYKGNEEKLSQEMHF